jgi:hypothetical protein
MVQEFCKVMARLYPLKSNKRTVFIVDDNSQHSALAADAVCLEERENPSQTHKETPLVSRNNTSNSNRSRRRSKQQHPAVKMLSLSGHQSMSQLTQEEQNALAAICVTDCMNAIISNQK